MSERRHSVPVMVRLTPEQAEACQAAADAATLPLSTWLRQVAVSAANKAGQ